MMARITNYLLFCIIFISASTSTQCQQQHNQNIEEDEDQNIIWGKVTKVVVLTNAANHFMAGIPANDGHTILKEGTYTPEPAISVNNQPINNTPSTIPQFNSNPQSDKHPTLAPENVGVLNVKQDAQQTDSVAASVLNLSQKILGNVLKNSKSKHLVISPTSISAALALVLLGAKGDTYKELLKTMQLPNVGGSICQIHQQFGGLLANSMAKNKLKKIESEPGTLMNTDDEDYDYDNEPREHKISVANALFLQANFTIRADYENAVKSVYQSSINRVDFLNAPSEAAMSINQWVNDKTFGKIKQIVGNNISPDSRMIIASALYFKAEWRKMFIEGANMNRKFYPDGKENEKNASAYMVEMMAHGGIFPFYQSEEFKCRIMGFTYAHGESTMYVIFPIDSDREKLLQLQEKLTAEKIEEMISQMKNTTAVILFPKLKLSSDIQLKRVLQSLGLESLFNIRESDLSLMSNGISTHSPIYFPEVTDDNKNWHNNMSRSKRDVKYKVESSVGASEPLNIKDLVLRKRISKKNPGKKPIRHRRELQCDGSLSNLDALRNNDNLMNPLLYADDIVHKVELAINERGTEGGAATAITLNRSGTKVVFRVDGPFLLLIRHEPTKLPLFYGAVFEPPGAN